MVFFSVTVLQIILTAVIIMKVIMMIITTVMMTAMITVMTAATTAVMMTAPGIPAGIRTQAGIQIPAGTPDMMTGDQTGRKI